VTRRGLLVLALVATACSDRSATPPGVVLRQPSAIAVFHGYTIKDPVNLRPYLAIANASRNDLSVVDAVDDTPVLAPIALETLVVPVDRPAMLASSSLGDGKPDLLVAVSAGSSELQLVRTWTSSNAVVEGSSVDLGDDVLAMVAVPSPPGTTRIAAALADRKLAIVEFARALEGIGIEVVAAEVQALDFQAIGLAAVPGDEARLYAASLEEIGGVQGVAEIDLSTASWGVRGIAARAPTRLVAAARLRERRADALAADATAFDEQELVTRVYAVVDEGSCGPGRRVDCGVVVLDPALEGAGGIPEDWAGWMPYRAPIRVPGVPLALAVAHPPQQPPSPADQVYHSEHMRLWAGSAQATTAVGAVASDDGSIYFLDLGRFKLATSAPVPPATGVRVTSPPAGARLWLQDLESGAFAPNVTEAAGPRYVAVTPGYTPTETWTVTHQGVLPRLQGRPAEAGRVDATTIWLALQVGDGPPASGRIVSQVVQLHHPALGVEVGDVVVLQRSGVCAGTAFEGRIAGRLPPSAAHPGGAVALEPPADAVPGCFEELGDAIDTGGGLATGLQATIRAGGAVLIGERTGYAGRPQLGVPFTLAYPPDGGPGDEEALLALCPLDEEPFDAGSCGPACRVACDRLVLARKARRIHHLSEDCGGVPGCLARGWEGFPVVNGPALQLRVGLDAETGSEPARDMSVRLETSSGIAPLSFRPSPAVRANGAIAFDRTPWNPEAGYRFLFSYPSDMVVDVTPSVTPPSAVVIR
jgi:hypothetical protein